MSKFTPVDKDNAISIVIRKDCIKITHFIRDHKIDGWIPDENSYPLPNFFMRIIKDKFLPGFKTADEINE